jgi:hypothetical protein
VDCSALRIIEMTPGRRPLSDREQALFGPRTLKERGSPEWCWQTVYYLNSCIRHVGEQWRQSEEVIEDLKQVDAWKVIPPDNPYGTFDAMLRGELRFPAEVIRLARFLIEYAEHGEAMSNDEDRLNGK